MTKKPRTFVLRYIPCGCHVREGCDRCNHTGYRTEHVPLADALQEVEEQNAAAYLESVKQDLCDKEEPGLATDKPPCPECGFVYCHAKDCSQHPNSPTVGKPPWETLMRYIEPGIGRLLLDNLNAAPATQKPFPPWLQGLADTLARYLGDPPAVEKPPTCTNCGAADATHILHDPLCSHCAHLSWHYSGTPALLTPQSARQSGARVEDKAPDCVHCGWPSRNFAVVKRIPPCPKCHSVVFVTVSSTYPTTLFDTDGTLVAPGAYGGFQCARCGTKVANPLR